MIISRVSNSGFYETTIGFVGTDLHKLIIIFSSSSVRSNWYSLAEYLRIVNRVCLYNSMYVILILECGYSLSPQILLLFPKIWGFPNNSIHNIHYPRDGFSWFAK